MSREFMVDLSLVGLYTAWVLLPLVPAILIYWLFPDTAVAVGGPLANLTVRASGAFAAYLSVFLVTYGLVQRAEETIDGFQHPFWRITGVVKILDRDGKEMHYTPYLDNIKVGMRPPVFDVAGYTLKVTIPQAEEFPLLILEMDKDKDKYEPAFIDLNKPTGVSFDYYHKTIEITKPIVIKQKSSEKESIAAQVRVDTGTPEASVQTR